MDVSTLHVGDHVRLLRPIAKIPAGTQGIVETVFSGADLYDIDFNAPFGLQLVLGTELEPIEREREYGDTDSAQSLPAPLIG
jgi:hypothetical protein